MNNNKIEKINQIKSFLDGKNSDLKYIVNIEAENQHNYATCMIHEPETEPKVENIYYQPFLYIKDLKALGIKAVIAKSFARIFYRNSINIGLPVIVCKDLYEHVEDGGQADLDLSAGTVTVDGQVFSCTKLPEYMQNILNAGGLIASLNKEEA